MNDTSLSERLCALGIRPRNIREGENRAPCPRCGRGRGDDALAVRIAAEALLWICHRCGWAGRATTSLRMRAPACPTPTSAPAPTLRRCPQPDFQEVWSESLPLPGTLGADYLARRACVLPPAHGDVRFHRGLFCKVVNANLPAIICRVSTVHGNRMVGIHRIYLNPTGSDRAVAKRRLGRAGGEPVCIRLFPDEDVEYGLGIAEGVETALSAARFYSPMWATIDAGQMDGFPPMARYRHADDLRRSRQGWDCGSDRMRRTLAASGENGCRPRPPPAGNRYK